MTPVDVSSLTQAAIGIATVAMPVVVAWASKEIISHFKIFSTAAAAQHVETGVQALADIALDALTAAAAQSKPMLVSDAVAGALNDVSAQLVKAAEAAGTTPKDLTARVTSATLAKLAAVGISPAPASTAGK